MEPIPESLVALERLAGTLGDDGDALADGLRDAAGVAIALVPGCIGLSITFFEQGRPYTVTAVPEDIAELDAIQYLDGGPCVDAAATGTAHRVDMMDEHTWQMFATVAGGRGVRSSLSVPIRRDGHPVGAVNFYGEAADSFDASGAALAGAFGGRFEDAVANGDLSFATLVTARALPARLEDEAIEQQAIGVVMQRERCEAAQALARMRSVAMQSNISLSRLAALVVEVARRV